MRLPGRTPFLLATLVAWIAPAPSAAFTITSHQRFVEAELRDEAGSTLDSERHDAPDLDPFQAGASVSRNVEFPAPGCCQAAADANQDSSIEESSIVLLRVTGTGDTFTSAFGPSVFAEAQSLIEIFFEISAPTPYSIDGSIYGEWDGSGSVFLLDQTGASVFWYARGMGSGSDGTLPFSESGLLDPGTYRFRALAASCSDEVDDSSCGSAAGWSSYTFTFVVPEPASGALLGLALAGLAARRSRVRARR